MLEARIISANSLSGLESMFHLVLLVCRVGVYVTRRSVKDHARAETTYTPLTFTPPVCEELSRLPDTVRVSTNRSYPLGSVFTQQTFAEPEPEPKVWGTTLAPENVTSEAGAPCGRYWCISHRGTDTAVGRVSFSTGEIMHRGPQSRNIHPYLPEVWGCVFTAGTQCVSKDGEATEDTVETRVGVPTSPSRVDSCVHCFSAKRHNTTMFTHSQEQLRKREAPSIWR